MTTYVEFECGGGEVLAAGRSVQDALDRHDVGCHYCPDLRTEHEKQLDQLHEANWNARIDAALAEAKDAS